MLTQFVVGSIPVISDERVKGYIQKSIRPQIGLENNVLFQRFHAKNRISGFIPM